MSGMLVKEQGEKGGEMSEVRQICAPRCFQSVQCGILNAALFGSLAMAGITRRRRIKGEAKRLLTQIELFPMFCEGHLRRPEIIWSGKRDVFWSQVVVTHLGKWRGEARASKRMYGDSIVA